MKKIGLILVICVFMLSTCFLSYADTSGKSTWDEMKASMEKRISQHVKGNISDSELPSRAYQEANYVFYACSSNQKDYDTYLYYANALKTDYDDAGYSYFTVMDEDTYNIKVGAFSKFSDFKSLNATMIADSGFRADKNGLPFYNPTVQGITSTNDVVTGGCCAGMSWLSIQNYLHGYTNIQFDYAKKYLESTYGSKVLVTDWKVDLADIAAVKNKNLYSYKPETDYLKAKMAPRGTVDKDAKLAPLASSIIELDKLKDSKDYDLIKAIALSAYTAIAIRGEGTDSLWKGWQEFESSMQPCPAEEIFEVQKEFEKGKPVYIIMTNRAGGTHAVVGYALGKDKVQTNKYYIYTYNNNNPGNYSLTGADKSDYYWIEVVLEKGSDGHQYAFYEFREVKTPGDEAAYASMGGSEVSRYTGNCTFTNAEGIPLHCSLKEDNFGARLLKSRGGEPVY